MQCPGLPFYLSFPLFRVSTKPFAFRLLEHVTTDQYTFYRGQYRSSFCHLSVESNGKRKVKQLPSPGVLSTATVPPMASVHSFTRARPRPVPLPMRVRVFSPIISMISRA